MSHFCVSLHCYEILFVKKRGEKILEVWIIAFYVHITFSFQAAIPMAERGAADLDKMRRDRLMMMMMLMLMKRYFPREPTFPRCKSIASASLYPLHSFQAPRFDRLIYTATDSSNYNVEKKRGDRISFSQISCYSNKSLMILGLNEASRICQYT